MGYQSKSVLINESPNRTVAASAVEQVISNPFPLSAEDSLYWLAFVQFSALVAGTGVTVKLQHTPGGSGTPTWYNVGSSAQAAAVQKTCTDANVTHASDNFNVSTHGFVTGDRVLVSTAGTLPTGLTAGEYWVIKVDADNLKLASSKANALAGTAVDISSAGSGTFRFCQADYTIRLLATDGTDVAQLPLWGLGRLVIDSGANDSATISAVRISERR